ncbi:MAG: S49 family peptidase [Arenicella sp.]
MKNQHLIDRAFNQPVLMEPGAARFFYAYLSSHVGADSIQFCDGEELDREGMLALSGSYSRNREDKIYQVVDGVAIIPVEGKLVHRYGYLNPRSGMTGYDGINAKINESERDADVKGIFFDINSPGGEVAGCFDLADIIAKIEKPTMAYADEMACSAAYAIASACDEIVLPRTGEVGSIGVVMAHMDISKAMEDKGVNVTLIHAGKHKVDGNPYEALPENVRSKFQADIDHFGGMFFSLVAKNRRMSTDAISSLEAATFRGDKAVTSGLADAVMPKNEAFNTFLNHVRKGANTTETTHMSKQQTGDAITAEQVGEQIADAEKNAATLATKAEGERIFAILESEESKGRTAAAIELAKSGLNQQAAIATLSKLPTESTQGDFVAQMDAAGGAGVEDLPDDEGDQASAVDSFAQTFKSHGGKL